MRFPQIDSLRAVAAMALLVSHVSAASGHDRSLRDLTHRFNAGLAVFFAISGFVLYRPYVAARVQPGARAPDLGVYALRRVVRIVPAYWLALTVLAVVPGLVGVVSPHFWVFYGFAQIYDDLARPGEGLFPAWTLCIEVTFYALLPFFAFIVARCAARWGEVRADVVALGALFAVAVGWHALYYLAGINQPGTFNWLPNFLDWFVPGMALAVISVRRCSRHDASVIDARGATACWAGAVLVFLVIWLVAKDPYVSLTSAQLNAFLYALFGLLLLAPAALDAPTGIIRRLLMARTLLWLGAISYGLYLWHYPLAFYFHRHVHDITLTLATTTAVTIVCAAASYYLMERPLMRLTHFSGRRRGAQLTSPLDAERRTDDAGG